jgi:glycosidase
LQSIYFVLVDRFANGDASNDSGVDRDDPAGWHGGDLQGVLDRLDYLQNLGVQTLWLSPIFQTRSAAFMGHGAFHGYWTTDLTRVDERFGDTGLLRKLAGELHRRRMRLMLDLVVNHVGYEADLVEQKPEWFHRSGSITDWNDPIQIVEREVHGLPDLDQEQPEVYAYLVRAARQWLEEARVDGFRLDAVKHVPLAFWTRFNRELEGARPGLLTLGEHFDGDPLQVVRVQKQGGFSHMFDFPLAFALKDVFCEGQSPGKLAAVLSNDRLYPDPGRLVTFLDNHDLPRFRTACEGDLERVRHALTAQFALRGVPCLTYGTEAGLEGAGEPENRGDMVFDDERFRPLKDHLATLLRLRRSSPVLETGATRLLGLDDGLLSLLRVLPDQLAWLGIHTGGRPVQVTLPAELAGLRWRDALTGRSCEGEFRLGPSETKVLIAEGAGSQEFSGWMPGVARKRRVQVRVLASDLQAQEQLVLVGSGPELGNWDPRRGAGLSNQGRGAHVRTLGLPIGLVFAYKLVAVGKDGSLRWEQRDDRYLFVQAGDGPLAVALEWESS